MHKILFKKIFKIQGTKTLSDGIYTIKTAVKYKKAVTYKQL